MRFPDFELDPSRPVFLLSPGHGVDTAGKRSPGKRAVDDGRPGIMEYEFNRDVVRRICRHAAVRGIQAVDLVPQDESLPLRERVRRANDIHEHTRAVFIAVHANAAGMGGWSRAHGARVFHSPLASPESRRLAWLYKTYIQERVPEFKGSTLVKKGGFFVLKKTKMPAILTENGFMTSRYDCEVLASDAGREAIALAHVDVMLDWVGVRVPPMTPLTPIED